MAETDMFGPLRAERIGSRRWRLIEDWRTPFGVVPAGFETDGVSSGPFYSFATPGGSLFEAAVVHDWMYVNAIESKAAADNAFYFTARWFGVNRVRAKAAYLMCVLFGRGAYSRA